MNLKQILSKRETLTGWFEFCDGFSLEIEYTDAFGIQKMLEDSKVQTWKQHQKVESYDDDKFAQRLASKVTNWKGLTLGVLADLTNIDITGMNPETEIEFTQENLIDAMKGVPALANFLRVTMMEITNFRRLQQAAEVKN